MTERLLPIVESLLERHWGNHRAVRGSLLGWIHDLSREDIDRAITIVEKEKIAESYNEFNEFMDKEIESAEADSRV